MEPRRQTALIQRIRELSGISPDSGPSDAHLFAALRGFAERFDYWYLRVMKEVVPKYRGRVIERINPFVRRLQFGDELRPDETAKILVADYERRNFVTAGGWALEEMAVCISPTCQKSASEGIDLQKYDHVNNNYALYVIKSGTVTRNSDIVSALKRNSKKAEERLRQGGATSHVRKVWAIAAGRTGSTFKDGIYRPSSAEFWADMTGLPEADALDLVLAVAAVAKDVVSKDTAQEHVDALESLVADYIAKRGDEMRVDWEFLAKRTMSKRTLWKAEDKTRHERALSQLLARGYELHQPKGKRPATSTKKKAARTKAAKRKPARKKSAKKRSRKRGAKKKGK